MLILAFDTETTGLPLPNKPLDDPCQPHIVSLSALQVDLSGPRVQQSTSKLVAPAGWEWEMDSPAASVHGLSPELCAQWGNPEKDILVEFLHLWFNDPKPALVAHNLEFDKNIIAIAIARYFKDSGLLHIWQSAPGLCTMLENKKRVDARNAKGNLKLPNLKETYKFFTGKDLERHHSANADAVAVYEIFLHMQQTGTTHD